MWRRLKNGWFLAALALALVAGLWQAPRLAPYADAVPRAGLIAAIMLVTALPMNFGEAGSARAAAGAVALAVGLNSGAAPLLAWAAGGAVPAEFAVGLIIAAASPCTIASAAVWTRRGGGNDAIAVLVTLVTNLACFAVLPFWVMALVGRSVEVDSARLVLMLLSCVVAPIGVAQLLRRAGAVRRLSSTHKQALSVASQLGVLTMAFIGAVGAGLKLRAMSEPVSALHWLAVAGTAAAVHSLLLAAGWWLSGRAGMASPERVAVAISGSQKTLTVGVGIALEFGGLAIFPMIAYHVVQLVIDTLFVDRLRARRALRP